MLSYPVAIIGGGPVGLAAALQLARLGVANILFERHESPSLHPKSRGISTRTLELFRLWGIETAVQRAGMQRQPVFYFGRDLVSPFEHVFEPFQVLGAIDDGRLSPCSLISELCSQDVLEPILGAAASRHGSELRFGWTVERWSQDDGGVVIEARSHAGERTRVHAQYLIAADGAGGNTRDRLGIGVSGAGPMIEAVSVLFRSDLRRLVDAPAGFFAIHNPETIGYSVIAPVDAEGRAALLGRPTVLNLMPADKVDWVAQLRLAVGAPDQDFEILDVRTWRAAERIADSYQSGRVFLAGDAAHLMPPNGGFNMNTGIQDVHNLAWKLQAVIAGWAQPQLLASYTVERRAIALFNSAEAVRNLRALTGHGTGARPNGFRREHYVHPGLALGLRYNEGAIAFEADQPRQHQWPIDVYEPSAAPGMRAPHFWIERGGVRASILDSFERHFVLLAPAACASWRDRAIAAAGRARVPLEVVLVGEGGDVADKDGVFTSLYGIGAQGAVLVRPDGHVGWRAVDLARGETLAAALDVLTGRIAFGAAA